MANHQHPNFLQGQPAFGNVGAIIRPMLVNAAQQQIPHPFCADGTHTLQFLNGCVAQIGQPLPPLCLIVGAIDHRPAQPTAAGVLPVTNLVLRNGDGHRIAASGWQHQAGILAALSIGGAYWFANCTARARYQQLDGWYRIGVDGRNAIVVAHTAAPPPVNALPHGIRHSIESILAQPNHVPLVQTGAGRVAPAPAAPIEEDANNNVLDHRFGVPVRAANDAPPAAEPIEEDENVRDHRFGVPVRARPPQRRAAQLVGLRVRLILEGDEEDTPDQRPYPSRKINLLPSFVISLVQTEKSLSCSICTCPFEIGESATSLHCFHIFHSLCIVPWLKTRCTCPLCKFILP